MGAASIVSVSWSLTWSFQKLSTLALSRMQYLQLQILHIFSLFVTTSYNGTGAVHLSCCYLDMGCLEQVVLATNVAETSLTVPGVRYVVDTGMVKSRSFQAKQATESLQVGPVSQAQARQRSGRAGTTLSCIALSIGGIALLTLLSAKICLMQCLQCWNFRVT